LGRDFNLCACLETVNNLSKKKLKFTKKTMTRILPFILLLFFTNLLFGQNDILDTGGPLMPEQAAYDVQYYGLDVKVNPDEKAIEGNLTMRATIVQPIAWVVMDLDTTFTIHDIYETHEGDMVIPATWQRESGKVWINMKYTRQAGSSVTLTLQYSGKPRVARRPPWDGGFTWAKTKTGAHWIATTCQGEGADLWWPNKDHVSDKPDRMDLLVTVPDDLVVASNGRLSSHHNNGDGTATWHWKITTPISNYNVALNIAPYKIIEDKIESVSGNTFPVYFYVLPEDFEKGQKFMPEIIAQLKWFESMLGPYPFQQDKYGAVQTPHLGMEHQSIIAYGANFKNGAMTGGKDWGFDALHQHELAHEWWGNLVTNADWKDMWIHEGFGSYMQPLYAEHLNGKAAYHKYMNSMYFRNQYPIAPHSSKTGKEIYKAPIYTKGAWVLHTLRYLIGDEDFFKAFKKMAYPDQNDLTNMDGHQIRFVTTEDFITTIGEVTGKDFHWFFDIYVRQGSAPVLISVVEKGELRLRWKTRNNRPFPMPVEVKLGDTVKRYEIPAEGLVIPFKKGDRPEVDPDRWILMDVTK
jgi:aminopeptidase N